MGRQRDAAQRARDRRVIADLYLQGWLQADIADKLKINQSTVSRDLRALQAEWLESALVDFDDAKARELAKVDRLEREYWRAWERSCEDAETTVKKTKGAVKKTVIKKEDGDEEDGKSKFVSERPAEVSQTAKGQAGDPRFLAGVQWCIDKRCKVLGIDAPVKLQLGGNVAIIQRVAGFDNV